MKIINVGKRLIILNYKNKKKFATLELPAGATVENEHLDYFDVAFYVGKKTIEVIPTEIKQKKEKKAIVPVVLGDDVTAESLKEMTVKDLRRYCKENNISIPANTDEDGVIAIILDSLELPIIEKEED